MSAALARRGLVGGDVDAGLRVDSTATRISRRVTLAGAASVGRVGLVVGLHLVVGDADLAHHLGLLDAVDEHLLLELPAQVEHRHAFLLQRRLELLLGLDLVFLADVLEDALELLVAHRVAELLAALDEQQLVDGVDDHRRRDLGQQLGQRRVVAAQRLRLRAAAGCAAICRCSRSVLVMISPFTFTRICSMMSADGGDPPPRSPPRASAIVCILCMVSS